MNGETKKGGEEESDRERERERERLGIPERVRERAQHVFPLSRSFRTAECSRSNAGVTFVVTATLVPYRVVERSLRTTGMQGGK